MVIKNAFRLYSLKAFFLEMNVTIKDLITKRVVF